jgi:hypothetical protein
MAWCLGERRPPGPVPHGLDAGPDKDHAPSDLLDRMYARSDKRSGAFDILAWSGESVVFAGAKHGGKDALRPSQQTWIEAALLEGWARENISQRLETM